MIVTWSIAPTIVVLAIGLWGAQRVQRTLARVPYASAVMPVARSVDIISLRRSPCVSDGGTGK